MLAALGDDFIYQHCIQELKRKREAETYRRYIADAIWCITSRRTLQRWGDLVDAAKAPADTRSQKEVISDLKAKFQADGGEVD